VIGDEGVGSAAGAGRVTKRFGVLEGGNSARLKCRFEGEGILEGLNLTESGVFPGGDLSCAVVVNLLSNVAGLRREFTEHGLEIRHRNMFGGINAEAIGAQTQ